MRSVDGGRPVLLWAGLGHFGLVRRCSFSVWYDVRVGEGCCRLTPSTCVGSFPFRVRSGSVLPFFFPRSFIYEPSVGRRSVITVLVSRGTIIKK